MILTQKSLDKLRLLINEETEYRSGPKLVQFFNALGSNDSYEQGFPSRWIFTDEKLKVINGTPEIDKCIRTAPSGHTQQVSMGGVNEQRAVERAREMIDMEIAMADKD